MSASEEAVLEGVRKQLYIGGKWRDGAEGGSIEVEDPATEETIASVADASAQDASDALAACADERADDLALLMTMEMGKSLKESKAEIAYASEFFRWFAEEAVRIEGRYGIAP